MLLPASECVESNSFEVDTQWTAYDAKGNAMATRPLVIVSIALSAGCVPPEPAPQSAPENQSGSRLESGIYAGQIQVTDQSLNQFGAVVSESMYAQSVSLTLSQEGIVVLDGAQIIQGQATTVDLGGGLTMTAFRRAVEVTPDGLVITSDLTTSDGLAGVSNTILIPAESGVLTYVVDILLGDGSTSFVSHGEGVLEQVYEPE